MTNRHDLEPNQPDDIVRLAERLESRRPVPAPGFRGDLRRRLLAAGAGPARPARLHAMIAGFAASGATLLGIAAVIS